MEGEKRTKEKDRERDWKKAGKRKKKMRKIEKNRIELLQKTEHGNEKLG